MATSGTRCGAVLAGGRGERLGGAKAAAVLDGRTLLDRALGTLDPVCDRRAVVAKPGSPLPPLPDGVERWLEPEADHHPRHGLVEAVRRTSGVVVVLAVDLPLVTPRLLAELAGALDGGAVAAVARAGGKIQPLCGAYTAAALGILEAAPPDEPLVRTVERLAPAVVEADPSLLHNVNTPGDLERASLLLARG